MVEQLFLTVEGAVRLRLELAELKGAGRDDLAKRLRSAIQMGDLSENADYKAAKEHQGFLEGRIETLEHCFKHAVIVETEKGVAQLRAELTELKKPAHNDLAKRLPTNNQKGNLLDINARIEVLEYCLDQATQISNRDGVAVGTYVTVQEDDFDDTEIYQIVGVLEADSLNNKISYESPLGRALMGKRNGEAVVVLTPGGELHLKILKVE